MYNSHHQINIDLDTYSFGFLLCTNAAQRPITAIRTTLAAATIPIYMGVLIGLVGSPP